MPYLDRFYKSLGIVSLAGSVALAIWNPWATFLPYALWIGWLQAGSI